jgi:hypothetical protein
MKKGNGRLRGFERAAAFLAPLAQLLEAVFGGAGLAALGSFFAEVLRDFLRKLHTAVDQQLKASMTLKCGERVNVERPAQ